MTKVIKLLSWAMGTLPLNRKEVVIENGRKFVLKQRQFYCLFIIPLGNLLIKNHISGTWVLPKKIWYPWETCIYKQLYDIDIKIDKKDRLKIPYIPGRSLFEILSSDKYEIDDKMAALAGASQKLAELHACFIMFDSQKSLFSHGDAIVKNVIFNFENRVAVWIDFDLAHKRHIPSQIRQGDDLRAMAFSVAACVKKDELPKLISILITHYSNQAVLATFQEMVSEITFDTDLVHLSQTLADKETSIHCKKCLLSSLDLLR